MFQVRSPAQICKSWYKHRIWQPSIRDDCLMSCRAANPVGLLLDEGQEIRARKWTLVRYHSHYARIPLDNVQRSVRKKRYISNLSSAICNGFVVWHLHSDNFQDVHYICGEDSEKCVAFRANLGNCWGQWLLAFVPCKYCESAIIPWSEVSLNVGRAAEAADHVSGESRTVSFNKSLTFSQPVRR